MTRAMPISCKKMMRARQVIDAQRQQMLDDRAVTIVTAARGGDASNDGTVVVYQRAQLEYGWARNLRDLDEYHVPFAEPSPQQHQQHGVAALMTMQIRLGFGHAGTMIGSITELTAVLYDQDSRYGCRSCDCKDAPAASFGTPFFANLPRRLNFRHLTQAAIHVHVTILRNSARAHCRCLIGFYFR
jgi:hypothetical protein